MASVHEDQESEFHVLLEVNNTSLGFLRAVGIGYLTSAALLNQLNESDFIYCLKKLLNYHLDAFTSSVTELGKCVDELIEKVKTYEEIIELVRRPEIQQQVEVAFAQLFQNLSKVQDPLDRLKEFLQSDGPSESLSAFAVELRIALNVQFDARNFQVRGTATGAYVHVSVDASTVRLLLPTAFSNMLESKRLEYALHENFDSHFNRAMVAFSKALGTVDKASAECIVPHSRLRSQLLELAKYDLTVEIPRVIVATKFTFTSGCRDCSQRERKVRLDCGHWKCKECIMVETYNRTQYHHVPEALIAFSLNECCTVTSDDLSTLLTTEEIEALHLELLRNPAA